MLGEKGAAAVAKGGDWREYMRGYTPMGAAESRIKLNLDLQKFTEKSKIQVSDTVQMALDGGKKSGFLKTVSARTDAENLKSIRNLSKRVAEHTAYIAEPVKYYPEWSKLDAREQKGCLKHWQKEVNNFNEEIEITKHVIEVQNE